MTTSNTNTFPNIQPGDRIMRLVEAGHRSGYAKSSMYELSAKGLFPPIIKLGPRASGILESQFLSWLADRVAASQRDRAPDAA